MKKVVGIFVTDTHLDKGNGELVKDIFDQLISLCQKYNTNRIFHGGDVFTNRSGQPLQCLTDWKDILKKLSQNKIELHVIPGNHDKTDSDDERSYLDVYTEPCVHLYRSADAKLIGGVCFAFIPFFRDEKWLEEYQRVTDYMADMSDAIDESPRILIAHSGFDGVRNNDGTRVESIIKPSMFKDWDAVLLGHYHNASELADNVIYTGSAYQNNYGENIADKGFTIIYSDGTTKFVPSKFPKYIKHTIDARDKDTLRNLIDQYDDDDRVDHIRFVFTGKKEDCELINIAEIQGKYGIDCKFQADEQSEAMQISEEDSVFAYDKKSIIKDFIKFCADNQIRGEQMKYGLELVKNY